MKRAVAAAALFASLASLSLPATPLFRLCPFHWITGLDCPLCGLTRALFALAKGHWHDALVLNALSPLAFAMLFALFWRAPWVGRLWTLGIAAFCIYGVARILVPDLHVLAAGRPL